jgi:haloacetate dehalogenase
MFDGFALEQVEVNGVTLRVRHGGSGPPVLLIHGHPRTHTTWHRVAPLLAEHHTVVCPDLRGYGQSSAPPGEADHSTYSKRAMASDCVALMRSLGHSRFAVVGHDRGSNVALRMALDAPDVVERLAFLGWVPIGEALARTDARFATAWWHWFFYGQLSAPERVINADPLTWYRLTGAAERLGPENHADVIRAVSDPATVHAMVEDYRAGLTVDRAHDDADRAAGRKVRCPTLLVWAGRDDPREFYPDLDDLWDAWAEQHQAVVLDSDHHVAEEVPTELAAVLAAFLADRPVPGALPRSAYRHR